jgi:rhodanese-related sulfurtransferase
MSECTVITLNENLGSEDLQLVDVREYAEFAGGRVSGAKLLPLGHLEKHYTELNHTKPIYVMCRTGNRSKEAQKKLKNLGFTNVINVTGGFEAWKKENLPFEQDENAPWALERQVRFVAGLFVLIGFALSFLHPYFIGLSVFIGAGLTFSAITDTCTMGLILAKMPWNKRAQSCEIQTS